ncbi:MAG: efflux RND transporter periplasmic adaptor subunit [Rhodospirillales bacterium]|nr:efflux RND transporter periplasmic adaptor subunit [Rhodospirillales bacterium]
MNHTVLEHPTPPAMDKSPLEKQPRRPHIAWRRLRRAALLLLIAIAVVVAFRFTLFQPPFVSTAEVVRGDVAAEVEGTGTVTADVLADIASKITGRVEQVFVDEGDTVQRGQIVATLDQTDLVRQVEAARARLAGATASAEERQREWNREQRLVKSGAVSVEDSQQFQERLAVAESAVQADQAEIEDAEYNLSLTQIPVLFNGIVTARWVVPGTSVVPGQKMFTVADTRLIYVNAYVDQNFTGKLRKGEAATVILRGRENQPLNGRVLRMSPQADAETEETVAEVAFTIPADEFQLGQWANVYIQVGDAKDSLTVPRAALLPMDNRVFVFVVGTGNKLRREAITVLAQSPRLPMVAVAGKLRPGELVVLMPMGLHDGETVRPRPAERPPQVEPQQ